MAAPSFTARPLYAPFDAPLRLALGLRRRCTRAARRQSSVVPGGALLGLRPRFAAATSSRQPTGGAFAWRQPAPGVRGTAVVPNAGDAARQGAPLPAALPAAPREAALSRPQPRGTAAPPSGAASQGAGAPRAATRAGAAQPDRAAPLASLEWRHLSQARRGQRRPEARAADPTLGARLLHRVVQATRTGAPSALDLSLRRPGPGSPAATAHRASVAGSLVRAPSVQAGRGEGAISGARREPEPVRAAAGGGAPVWPPLVERRADGAPRRMPAPATLGRAHADAERAAEPVRGARLPALLQRRAPQAVPVSRPELDRMVSEQVQRALERQQKGAAPSAAPRATVPSLAAESAVVDRLASIVAGRLQTMAREERFRAGRIR